MVKMTKRLEEAMELVRDLPDEEQDRAAEVVFIYLSSDEREGAPDEIESSLMHS
jgi:hypothetical protein